MSAERDRQVTVHGYEADVLAVKDGAKYRMDVLGHSLPSGKEGVDVVPYYPDDYSFKPWGILMVKGNTEVGITWDSILNFQIRKRDEQ